VLLIDDDPSILRSYGRNLSKAGYEVVTAKDGAEALTLLAASSFDVIVSDISMPRIGGIELLRAVRERDLDVPVLLMTAGSVLKPALQAVEYGASQFLLKPLEQNVLQEAVARAIRLHELAKLKRRALEISGVAGKWLGDRAALEARFARALESVWMAFQPIVSWRRRTLFGYEALVRNQEPTLEHPDHLLEAAESLNRLTDLGRIIRGRVAAAASEAPEGARLFINLHAADLDDEELCAPSSPVSRIAGRVVFEVTERASLNGVKDVRSRLAALRKIGFAIAVDDLGAGYAGLSSFTQLEPEIVKLDMALIRGIDSQSTKRVVVQSMVQLCNELGILVIAEGVETPAEREMLVELGCDLLQGYLFGKPARGFMAPAFDVRCP
jgi:EAL domain-containing protein (putative c-di-GMP-specific phosphodiesterase class I)